MIPYSLRPRPAPDCWPMPYHRNMAEVARDEAAMERSKDNLRRGKINVPMEKIVHGLDAHQVRAITMQMPKVTRAGALFPGAGSIAAHGWLKRTPLFERYMHNGYLAYRLTPLGCKVREYIQRGMKS